MNPYTNKVILGTGETVIDLTGDNVTAADVKAGKTFHLSSGEPGTGSFTVNLQNKTATQNGSVTADGGYDGLGTVTVNVPSPEVWVSGKTYAAGAYCEHNGYLWHNTSGTASTGVEPGTNYNVWNVTYSNENLLDNPWFTVNQRGQTSYAYGYTVDRWKIPAIANVRIQADHIELENSGNVYIFEEIKDEHLTYGTYTLSVKMYDGTIYAATGTHDETHEGEIAGINLQDGWSAYVSHNIESDSYTCTFVDLLATTTKKISAIKLEFGSVSTLANDTAPDYNAELGKCMKYFQRFRSGSGYWTQNLPTNKAAYSPEMRVNPSISTMTIGGVSYRIATADL